jgi:hypothetical protein
MSTRLRLALPSLLVAAVMMIGLTGCDWDDTGASLFDPNHSAERPDPVVTEVVPAQTTLAGVGQVVIHGSNFSAVPDENVVLFAQERATVLEASPERLVVRAPSIEGEAVPVRVTVIGAMHYSQERSLRLIPAVTARGGLVPQESPRGIAVDEQGNVYASLFFGASPAGVIKITPENQREQFLAAQGWPYVDMAVHPDGHIYMARGALAVIYRVSLDDPAPPGPWLFQPAMGPINRLDVDEWGSIWAGGNSGNIHRIETDQSRTAHPFEGDIRGIAYGNGYLYISAVRSDVGGLWRAPVTASSLGEFEQVLDFAAMSGFSTFAPGDVVVRDDGNVFLGTGRAGFALLEVTPSGSWSSFYGNIPTMQPTLTGLAFGPNNYLYGARQGDNNNVVRIDLQWREGR